MHGQSLLGQLLVTDLLVYGGVEVVIYIKVHKLSAVLFCDHDVFAIILQGHSQGLANAWHPCCEVLAKHILYALCACSTSKGGAEVLACNKRVSIMVQGYSSPSIWRTVG